MNAAGGNARVRLSTGALVVVLDFAGGEAARNSFSEAPLPAQSVEYRLEKAWLAGYFAALKEPPTK